MATYLRHQVGPWSNQTHVAPQHAPHLGKFVQRRASQESTDPGDAGIVLDFEHRTIHFVDAPKAFLAGFGVHDHAAEFGKIEFPAVAADTTLHEENRAAVMRPYQECDREEDRSADQHENARDDDVGEAFAYRIGCGYRMGA
jgi:hypothetical protein